MAVRMRLRREGKRKQPFYRVVVADGRSPRDGRFIEDIGYYQPLRSPSEIAIDRDRALYWLSQGVQPSDPVLRLLRVSGIWAEFRPDDSGGAAPATSDTGSAPGEDVEASDPAAAESGDDEAASS